MKANLLMKRVALLATACAGIALSGTAAAAQSYTFVGSWHVGDGPIWTGNPTVYSGQDAAALLFGGTASQYAISTIGADPTQIDFRAHVDGYGDTSYLYSGTVAQDYKASSNGAGYDSYPSFSAYVLDHSCTNRYSDLSQTCGATAGGVNYAFKMGAVPEPASWAMLICGVGAVGGAMRRRRAPMTTRVRFA